MRHEDQTTLTACSRWRLILQHSTCQTVGYVRAARELHPRFRNNANFTPRINSVCLNFLCVYSSPSRARTECEKIWSLSLYRSLSPTLSLSLSVCLSLSVSLCLSLSFHVCFSGILIYNANPENVFTAWLSRIRSLSISISVVFLICFISRHL